LHAIERTLSPIERTLSEYARTPWGRCLFPTAAFAIAGSAACLTVVLRYHGAPLLPISLLAAFAFSFVIAGAFRADDMDPRQGELEMTRAGAIHASAGMSAIVSICVAAPLLTDTFRDLHEDAAIALLAGWVPTLGAAVFVVSVVARSSFEDLTGRPSLHGLGERVGFAAFLSWLMYASTALLAAQA
jgi:hypothetical protein